MRSAVAALLISMPSIALGQQAGADDPSKVSNDQPDRPLQMPPASGEAKEAFDDFERFARRGAWERAAKALYAIPKAQETRFVDGKDRFIIPVARKRREVLSALSPEGQAAYRLFYDAEAKALLEKAEGPAEMATLEQVVSAYFPSTVGPAAADRLGDLTFERGQFDRAADAWLMILRERPDADVPPAPTAVKAALALSKAGRASEADALRREVEDRFADEAVSLGGVSAKAPEQLRRLLGPGAPPAGSASAGAPSRADGPPPDLGAAATAAWQFRFGASVTAGMSPTEVVQWDDNPLGQAIPAVAADGGRVFVNYLGYVVALDLATGKMLWRSGSFHNVDVVARQGQARMVDTKRFAVAAANGLVWTLGRDIKDPNYMAPFRLACRRAGGGEVVWQTGDLPDYGDVDLAGPPTLGPGALFIAAKSSSQMMRQNQPQQFVLAIRPHDGKLLWRAEVGVARQNNMYSYYGYADNKPQPRIIHRAGAVYVDTHDGILARLDAETGRLDWGYGYPTEPAQMGYRFFFSGMGASEPTALSSAPLVAGDALLVKGAKADRVCAIDPDRVKALWDRPIAKSSRLLGVVGRTLYLGGPELGALDLETRSLRWSTRLPGGSEEAAVIVRPEGLWQFTPRGIFEVDPATGRVRRIARGEDGGSSGGDLIPADGRILAISNRALTAYPRGSAAAPGASANKTGGGG